VRLADKFAVIFGAGQAPGIGMGNGRATALVYSREGATVVAVDRDLSSAEETAELVRAAGGSAQAVQADVTEEASVKSVIDGCISKWGRIDILHNNVGISVAGGDASVLDITVEAFDRIMAVNLRGTILACKHALPYMREQRSGAIINISSFAAIENYPWVSYKASKAGMIAFTKQVAIQNAEFGIRANVIMPGLMDTPMAVDTRAAAWGRSRDDVAAERDARVPLRHKQGSAWDVAHAALFLASEEAGFITGVELLVDGGAACRVG
jgi:NAD(P)-dependent dehydrogenase (short-subunit alcohol dehydrogenase family)